MNVNLDLLIPLVVTTAFGIVGYFVTHRLAAARDQANKRRELRAQYLIDAFRALVDLAAYSIVSERPAEIAREAERALSIIQLLGTTKQIQLFRDVMLKQADIAALLNDLQNELRQVLKLKRSDVEVIWLRLEHQARTNATVSHNK